MISHFSQDSVWTKAIRSVCFIMAFQATAFSSIIMWISTLIRFKVTITLGTSVWILQMLAELARVKDPKADSY